MKIIKFKARKVHGYLDMEIDFNDELSLLIGGNGSGKTTALKLMQALISPSFKELILIEFEELVLVFNDKKKDSSIRCIKNKDIITLSVSGVKEMLAIDNIEYNEIQYLSNGNNENILYEKIQEMPIQYRKHPVVEYIISLPSPIFLGLDRKNEIDEFANDNRYTSKTFYGESYSKSIRNRRLYEGNLNSGLMDAQYLVQDYYRNMKNFDERNINKMKENLLLSSFKYRDFNINEFQESLGNWRKKKELLNKKDEVLEVLSKIENRDKLLTRELNQFFERLNELISDSNSEDVNQVDLELIINMAQIDKIFDLVNIVQNHKEKTDRMYSKVINFNRIINDFYRDSNKYIEVDAIGKINVKRPNGKKCPISALSSGERQLLVIFAHVFFNKHNEKEKVFIIDEPELSLHLRWQQMFVKTILENSNKTQFIMATHSPDIVDDYDDSVIKMWRS